MTDPVLPPGGPATPDLTGTTLGGYTILRRLGRGGMADVYLATQDSLGRRIALKVLKPELARDQNYVRRFHNEAKSVAALVHPNIVQVYEIGEQSGLHFIAQEYVPGHSLKQRLKREGSLSVDAAIQIITAAASALEKAASAGMIHRDIKPDNILLDSDGTVKVADFGLARRTDASALELTQTGMTMGTPLYMSPEQIEGRSLDGRSDLYSLGVTAYHMLAGRPPFEGDTPLAVAMKHVNQAPQALTKIRETIPDQLANIVHRMMAKSPEDRPGSGTEVLEALRACEGIEADGKRVDTISASSAVKVLDTALASHRAPPRPWLSRGTLVAGVIGVLSAAVLFGRDPLRPSMVEQRLSVPRKETAEKQYFFAMHTNTEEAWLAVLDYFPIEGEGAEPVNRAYHLLTKKQLIRWYMQQGEPHRALPLADQLADLDQTDREFQRFGQATKVILLANLGRPGEATSLLTDIWEQRDQLDSPTRSALEKVSRQLRRAAKEAS